MSYKPEFTCLLERRTGATGAPPNSVVYTDEPCAMWFSRGRSKNRSVIGDPVIVAQVAMEISRYYLPPGWTGTHPAVWDSSKGDLFWITVPGSVYRPQLKPVYAHAMWAGTGDAHVRFDCMDFAATGGAVTFNFPIGRTDGFATTFSVYRPFGAATPVISGQAGTMYEDLVQGRGSYSGGNYLVWSHLLIVNNTIDVRDGVSRPAGLSTFSYADGDEVRWTSGTNTQRGVVVNVSRITDLLGGVRKAVRIMRDQPTWPN